MLADNKLIKEIKQFDDSFPIGIYTVPRSPNMQRVKVRALWEYCQEHGLEPNELSLEEIEQFLD
jgi:hypothetical protein